MVAFVFLAYKMIHIEFFSYVLAGSYGVCSFSEQMWFSSRSVCVCACSHVYVTLLSYVDFFI